MIVNWIQSIRLRTLPLSLATIGMGSILALHEKSFNPIVFVLTLLTALLLQILSNLSNDFGDFTHGADNNDRQGPIRTVQSGKISPFAMKIAIVVSATLSLLSGLALIFSAKLNSLNFILVLIAGIASILAAMAYTLGKKPYGYRGLGDIFVFLFFGWVGVIGTYYLQAKVIDWQILLPSSCCGFFITGVLNVNNLRDYKTDKSAGKRTIPVLIGLANAKIYHTLLLTLGWLAFVTFTLLNANSSTDWLFMISLPLFIFNGVQVWKKNDAEVDFLLRQLVFSILFFILLIGTSEFLK